MSIEIPVTLAEGAVLPRYQSADAAGMDLCSTIDFSLEPLERMLVPTGLRMEIPRGYEGQVRPRSGLALKYGISMVNAPGTIDSDYRGEIGVLLVNLGQNRVEFKAGERVAQLVISPVIQVELKQVDSLSETERGAGGFGSTGKN
ncbi:MAG: deoxyuridine 5'-triphosphate nucleotidohydrolase [Armatimonadetes bacterium Cent15-Ar3]|nr:MAG: deoxyuridine 5'-triphosphate nucleotidohydrolase [Armatimonadetes bacterium Cent15-Ar3]